MPRWVAQEKRGGAPAREEMSLGHVTIRKYAKLNANSSSNYDAQIFMKTIPRKGRPVLRTSRLLEWEKRREYDAYTLFCAPD